MQKRLNRGHKFFDSGDYNMARAKISQQHANVLPPQTEEAILHESTGDKIATPDSVPAVRKKSVLPTALSCEIASSTVVTCTSPTVVSPRSSWIAPPTHSTLLISPIRPRTTVEPGHPLGGVAVIQLEMGATFLNLCHVFDIWDQKTNSICHHQCTGKTRHHQP